ncbi:hypothetical protein Tcan_01838 [Toxocara canis]|uniref:KID domain-containing protein n=1 Tax=Toxocara canis TaxID=6265 RepID=A0A0B2V9K8_TOXCA|nr:hypothetical protein Tcan_01838 [Toxocara canis]
MPDRMISFCTPTPTVPDIPGIQHANIYFSAHNSLSDEIISEDEARRRREQLNRRPSYRPTLKNGPRQALAQQSVAIVGVVTFGCRNDLPASGCPLTISCSCCHQPRRSFGNRRRRSILV